MAKPEGYLRIFVDAGQPMATLLYQVLRLGQYPDYVPGLLALFPTNDEVITASLGKSTSTNIKPADESLIEPLTEREIEVLQLMASGSSNEEIAGKLVIAPTTAKKHVSNILHKLGADNRTQAVVRGRSLGLCQ